MTRQVALLRGINLGARRRVAMGELREMLGAAGHGDVRTHLQSGNVVLTNTEPPERLARTLERQIRDAFGFEVDVIVRTRDELAGVVERDPFGDLVDDPRRYQVSFLSAEPDPRVLDDLGAANIAPERVYVSGLEVYAWHPNGIQRSPLAGMLTDRRLGVRVTARNWNTVTRLLALAEE